jgi:hypothetical protein
MSTPKMDVACQCATSKNTAYYAEQAAKRAAYQAGYHLRRRKKIRAIRVAALKERGDLDESGMPTRRHTGIGSIIPAAPLAPIEHRKLLITIRRALLTLSYDELMIVDSAIGEALLEIDDARFEDEQAAAEQSAGA